MKYRNGILITTSFNMRNREGWYLIVDLSTGKILIKQKFENTTSSDNVMGFLAICATLEYTSRSLSDQTIYCCNKVSMAWVKKKICNSKMLDWQTQKLVRKCITQLSENDSPAEIKFWKGWWKKPEDSLYYPEENLGADFDFCIQNL